MDRYTILNETRSFSWYDPKAGSNRNVTVYRIQANMDFTNLATSDAVKSGDKGGWIEGAPNLTMDSTTNDTCWVFDDAVIFGDVIVSDHAALQENAVAYSSSSPGKSSDFTTTIKEYCIVGQNAQVGIDSAISGHAIITSSAIVKDSSQVSGFANIGGSAVVEDESTVGSNAILSGNARVSDGSTVDGEVQATQSVNIADGCTIKGKVTLAGSVNITDFAEIDGDDVNISGSCSINGVIYTSTTEETVKKYPKINGSCDIRDSACIEGDVTVSGNVKMSDNTRARNIAPDSSGTLNLGSGLVMTENARVEGPGSYSNQTLSGNTVNGK